MVTNLKKMTEEAILSNENWLYYFIEQQNHDWVFDLIAEHPDDWSDYVSLKVIYDWYNSCDTAFVELTTTDGKVDTKPVYHHFEDDVERMYEKYHGDAIGAAITDMERAIEYHENSIKDLEKDIEDLKQRDKQVKGTEK